MRSVVGMALLGLRGGRQADPPEGTQRVEPDRWIRVAKHVTQYAAIAIVTGFAHDPCDSGTKERFRTTGHFARA